ncbi:MAG: hypothetical protein QM765_21425 [Myxococcales bacterium]
MARPSAAPRSAELPQRGRTRSRWRATSSTTTDHIRPASAASTPWPAMMTAQGLSQTSSPAISPARSEPSRLESPSQSTTPVAL